VQYGVVDLDLGVLELVGHHVKQVLTLGVFWHQRLAMVEPRVDGRLNGVENRSGIAPAVAKYVTVLRNQHRVACGVSNTDQHLTARRLTVLIEPDRRLDTATRVDRPAGNVTEQGVKRAATDLTAGLYVKVGVVVCNVSEPFIPLRLLDAAQLTLLDLINNLLRVVGEHVRRF
jgi:hypothetical protein